MMRRTPKHHAHKLQGGPRDGKTIWVEDAVAAYGFAQSSAPGVLTWINYTRTAEGFVYDPREPVGS